MQVCGSYLVALWLVLQLADIGLPIMKLSSDLMSHILAVGMAGLPVCILIGWFVDLKRGVNLDQDQPRPPEAKTIVAIITVLCVFTSLLLQIL
jgi:hypothetical protein